MRSNTEKSLEGWVDKRKHHSGSVLCVSISPSSRLLATGSNDNTCKLWSIVSYSKSYQNIETEMAVLNQFIQIGMQESRRANEKKN